jgi:hypothetical protein
MEYSIMEYYGIIFYYDMVGITQQACERKRNFKKSNQEPE